jgi:hypothetical protein
LRADVRWEVIGDDVFVPRRGRGVLADGGEKKRRLPEDDVFIPRRAPRSRRGSRPDVDADVVVVSRRAGVSHHDLLHEETAVAPQEWDGVWDVASAAAAVESSNDFRVSDPTEILAAHLASGWSLRPRRSLAAGGGTGRGDAVASPVNPFNVNLESLDLCPPRSHASIAGKTRDFSFRKTSRENETLPHLDGDADARDALGTLRTAYGLATFSKDSKELVSDEDEGKIQKIATSVCRLTGAVSAARLVCVGLRNRRMCRAALAEANAAVRDLAKLVSVRKQSGKQMSSGKKTSSVTHAIAARIIAARDLASGVTTALRDATQALDQDEGLARERFENNSSQNNFQKKEKKRRDDPFAAAMASMAGVGKDVGDDEGDDDDDNDSQITRKEITPQAVIHLAVALDQTWFRLAYYEKRNETKRNATEKENGDFCAAYFAAVSFLGSCGVPYDLRKLAMRVKTAAKTSNPLLTVLHCRLNEGARLFHDAARTTSSAVGESAVQTAANERSFLNRSLKSTKGKKQKKETLVTLVPPPCPALTQKWRDASRDWPCRLFAFAAPTRSALSVLKNASKRWLEIGAGNGYWASLMSRHGMDTIAVDCNPPGNGTHNEYHGQCASWCDVERGNPGLAFFAGMDLKNTSGGILVKDERYANRSILLCYPPPCYENTMAVDTLEQYLRGAETQRGEASKLQIAVVGEWHGNTAGGAFARKLHQFFYLWRREKLPQWGDTCHDLTVWRSREPLSTDKSSLEKHPQELPLKQCAWCSGGRVAGDAVLEKDDTRLSKNTPLRRCTLCRDDCGTFCSARCCALGVDAHATAHRLRLIPTPTAVLVDFEGMYAEFEPFGGDP